MFGEVSSQIAVRSIMKHKIHTCTGGKQSIKIANIPFYDVDFIRYGSLIGHTAGRKIIKNNDFMPFIDKRTSNMGADKPAPASN